MLNLKFSEKYANIFIVVFGNDVKSYSVLAFFVENNEQSEWC